MNVFNIRFHNIANPSYVFTMPVLADTLDDALRKARDYPYATNWICVCANQEGKQMNQLTKDQLHHIAVNYLPREGGFAQRLADAYLYADTINQERIESAFAHLFVTAYRKWAQPEGEEQ